MTSKNSLYARLGGYDSVSAVVDDLLPRLMSDSVLRRFWDNRGTDGLEREKQLLIDYLCASAGGPVLYTGRDNKTSHKGMGITEKDWEIFVRHLEETLNKFNVPDQERNDVLEFIASTKTDIVD
tara:strand:- start:632 stop:1003 length:372 start_codon:yes stop_codon:yes gene_type:complete